MLGNQRMQPRHTFESFSNSPLAFVWLAGLMFWLRCVSDSTVSTTRSGMPPSGGRDLFECVVNVPPQAHLSASSTATWGRSLAIAR